MLSAEANWFSRHPRLARLARDAPGFRDPKRALWFLGGRLRRSVGTGLQQRPEQQGPGTVLRHLTATEYDKAKLQACDDERTTFAVGDAQDLSAFTGQSMDPIFSSNMIEHLRDFDRSSANVGA
jgi:hypothetical protein